MGLAVHNSISFTRSVQAELFPSTLENVRVVHSEMIARAVDDMFGRVHAMRSLPENWDSYSASPPSQAAIVKLLNIVREVIGNRMSVVGSPAIPYVVAPLPDGGVQAEWRCGSRAIEVDVNTDGTFGYLIVTRDSTNTQTAREEDHVDESAVLERILSVVA
jgi:hypothetical protein